MCQRNGYLMQVKGRLIDLAQPVVMGILNVTPDSFYEQSRQLSEQQIAERTRQIISEGAGIIDVGACSTRPGGDIVDEQEEWTRLEKALSVVRKLYPEAIVSVDTFRAQLAERCVREFQVDIINDISEGADRDMFDVVARCATPYVLTSNRATVEDTLLCFAEKVQMLRNRGCKDIILDPGFGFGKTLHDNYALMAHLERLHVMQLPLLVGVSRKSMAYRLLDTTPDQVLEATTALHALALYKGAAILRVHDVKAAVDCCRVTQQVLQAAIS